MGTSRKFPSRAGRQLGHPSGLRDRVVGAMLNRRNRAAVGKAVAALELSGTETALDIGFGDHARRARGGFGNEIAAGRLQLHEGSMTALPLDGNAVDAIVSTNTIYFVDDLGAAFSEVARVLAPGGRFVLGIGDPDLMGRSKMLTDNGFRIRPVDEVETALSTAGPPGTRHEKFGHSGLGFHLLIAGPR